MVVTASAAKKSRTEQGNQETTDEDDKHVADEDPDDSEARDQYRELEAQTF